ncbi:MAG: hypothetical protein WCP57_11135 [Bacteroidota bacterium]
MQVINKYKPYLSDYFLQSLLFYIFIISPIGVLPYYIIGSDGTNSLLWTEIHNLMNYFSTTKLLKTIFNLLVWLPFYSILLSTPLTIANVYILKINTYTFGENEYFTTKILFMFIVLILLVPYLLLVSLGNYHTAIYAAFPAILTSILYLLFVIYKQKV